MKRGALQIDWIMSLFIFLVYLAWFFVYLRPISQPTETADALLTDLKDSFINNASWSMSIVPLFVQTNLTGKEPLIASFPLPWNEFAFKDNTTFELREEKLFFTKTLVPGVNTYFLARSSSNYPTRTELKDLAASSSFAVVNSKAFTAEIDNSLIRRITYQNGQRIRELNISLNDAVMVPQAESITSNITPLLAEYKIQTDVLNHSSFIMEGHSRVFNFVRLNQPLESHTLMVKAVLDNYTSYYVTEADRGRLDYNQTACTTRLSRYIDFYNAQNGLTIITGDDANITNCQDENGLRVKVDITLRNESQYDFIFHTGDFNNTLKYLSGYTSRLGIIENVTGISMDSVARINATSYATLKDQWNFPIGKNFNFQFENSTGTVIYNYEPVTPSSENVFVKEGKFYAVDKYGDRKQHTLRIKGW